MPGAVKLKDVCTGHGCFGSRPNSSGSSNVYINNEPAHRRGDGWMPHGCPGVPPHGGNAASGSKNVFTNNKDQERIGDPISCGSFMRSGSTNVFVN